MEIPLYEQRGQHQRCLGKRFYEHVKARACRVFKRVPYGVPNHSRLVRFRALSSEGPCLYVLLGVVPRPTAIVHYGGEQDTRYGAHHEECRDSLCLEDHPDRHGEQDCKYSREYHVLERSLRGYVHAFRVIGLLLPGHYPLVLELAPDLFDYVACRLPYGPYGKRAEQKYQHGPEHRPCEDLYLGYVHDRERSPCQVRDLTHVGREEQERGQGCGAYGIPFCEGLGRFAYRLQPVRVLPYLRRRMGHLHDAAGVVRYRAERVHGKYVCGCGEHSHGRYGSPVKPSVRDS